MSGRRAIVIAVDGLRASALGAYGNSWHPTPALDALAAQSMVVDWLFGNGPTLADFYRGVWGNDHALLQRAKSAGVICSLVTDVAELPGAESFAEAILVATDADEPATDVSQTGFASVLAVAAEQLEAWSKSSTADDKLLWIHMRGFTGPWDAPHELRVGLLDDDDPAAPTFVSPPRHEATVDQDRILGYRAAYAAQAIALDECVGGLMAALADLGFDDRTLVVVVGCRGYALGEHGAVGSDAPHLYGESLHVPCFVRRSVQSPPPPRHAHLSQGADLLTTMGVWFGIEDASDGGVDLLATGDDGSAARQFVVAKGADGEQLLRTPAWLLRAPPTHPDLALIDGNSRPELYVKPDDRWEANEISDRCGSVAERLMAALERYQRLTASASPEPLDADLVQPSR